MKKYLTAVLSGLLLSASAHAATVTYNYTASVYLIYNYDYTRPFPLSPGSITLSDGSVGIGDVYTASSPMTPPRRSTPIRTTTIRLTPAPRR
jgi:hypothetical protein